MRSISPRQIDLRFDLWKMYVWPIRGRWVTIRSKISPLRHRPELLAGLMWCARNWCTVFSGFSCVINMRYTCDENRRGKNYATLFILRYIVQRLRATVVRVDEYTFSHKYWIVISNISQHVQICHSKFRDSIFYWSLSFFNVFFSFFVHREIQYKTTTKNEYKKYL